MTDLGLCHISNFFPVINPYDLFGVTEKEKSPTQ